MSLDIGWTDAEMSFRLILAVILAAIVGIERETVGKAAGLRTHIFVSMGACLFTLAPLYINSLDPHTSIDIGKVIAGVATGVGFIGAGSIIAHRGEIIGLTTAASLWVVAGIGMMIGLGYYVISIVATILCFFILNLYRIEVNMHGKKNVQ